MNNAEDIKEIIKNLKVLKGMLTNRSDKLDSSVFAEPVERCDCVLSNLEEPAGETLFECLRGSQVIFQDVEGMLCSIEEEQEVELYDEGDLAEKIYRRICQAFKAEEKKVTPAHDLWKRSVIAF